MDLKCLKQEDEIRYQRWDSNRHLLKCLKSNLDQMEGSNELFIDCDKAVRL